MDNELVALIDSAIMDAQAKSMEEVEKFNFLSQDIEEVVDGAEREFKKARKQDFSEKVSLSVIFVSEESIQHLKYIQGMRVFLMDEARKMVGKLLAERELEEKEGKKPKKGKKRSRSNN